MMLMLSLVTKGSSIEEIDLRSVTLTTVRITRIERNLKLHVAGDI